MKLRGFLARLSQATQGQISRFVIGNPSVDYDSFFGSIILAYILSSTTGNMYQPMIDCSRQDLNLRFEITGILQKVNINTDGLYFRQSAEDIYPQGVFSLYDHNERAGLQKVQYIVDHHAYSEEKLKTNNFIIDKMGSGLTILYYLLEPRRLKQIKIQKSSFLEKYQKFIQNSPFLKNQQNQWIDRDINEIIRNGVIIDTFNFDAKMKERWTIFDKMAVEFIQQGQMFDYGHKQIEQIKFDEKKNKALTLQQSLVKDRKIYTYGNINVAYSIIYLEPKIFFQNHKQQKFDLNEQKTDIYILMFLYRHSKQQFRRQIMYIVKNKQQEERVNLAFEKVAVLFDLKAGQKFNQWNRYIDPSATISRKKFQPQISQALKEFLDLKL